MILAQRECHPKADKSPICGLRVAAQELDLDACPLSIQHVFSLQFSQVIKVKSSHSHDSDNRTICGSFATDSCRPSATYTFT